MRTMPRLLLLLFCMSVVTMMFIARCGLNMDSQVHDGHHGSLPLPSGDSPGERALREVMRRKEVEHIRDRSALQEKIRSLESKLDKVQGQVVNLTASIHSANPEARQPLGFDTLYNGRGPRYAGRYQGAAGNNNNDNNYNNYYNKNNKVFNNRNNNNVYINGGNSKNRYIPDNNGINVVRHFTRGGPNEENANGNVYPRGSNVQEKPIRRERGGSQGEKTAVDEPEIGYNYKNYVLEPHQIEPDNSNNPEARNVFKADFETVRKNSVDGANFMDYRENGGNFLGGGAGARSTVIKSGVLERHALGVLGDGEDVGNDNEGNNREMGTIRRVEGSKGNQMAPNVPNGQKELQAALNSKQQQRLQQKAGETVVADSNAGDGGNAKKDEGNVSSFQYENYFHERLKSAEILQGQPYKTEYELIPFNRFIFNRIFLVDPGLGKRVVERPIGSKKKDLNEIMSHAVDSLNKNRTEGLYTHDDFVEGVYRTDPAAGSHFELYFTNKDDTSREHRNSYVQISVVRPFAPPVTVQQRTVDTNSEWVNIILPLSGRIDTFRIFMDQFINVCIKHDKRTYLTVVYFGTDYLKEVRSIMGQVAKVHKFKHMKLVTLNETFARGRGLQIGALNWKGGDVLLFFCDVDIMFTYEFLERCRLNSERGARVYYPIVFSLYNPRVVYSLQDVPIPSLQDQLILSKDTGFWRDFGYGMTCQYRSDFLRIKGFDEQITGWGGEDVFLYQKFVRSDFFVIRATDPAIFHLWHEKYCDPTLSAEQYRSCIRSKALNEASHPQLGLLAFKDEVDVHRSVSEKNNLVLRTALAETGKENGNHNSSKDNNQHNNGKEKKPQS